MNRFSIAIAALLCVSFTPLEPIPGAIAQSAPSIRFNPAALPPPPDLGSPGGQSGAGRRPAGACAIAANDLTVLVPTVQPGQAGQPASQWGTTTAAHPTFWLQFSRALPKNGFAELTLLDSTDTPVNRTAFAFPDRAPGVISLEIPPTAPPLQLQQYHWKITLYCDSGDSADVLTTLRGGIQRIAPSPTLQRQLAAAHSPLEQATVYAAQGVWYDALTALGGAMQTTRPPEPEIARAWIDLLRQATLEASITAPVLPCCAAKQSSSRG